MNVKVKRRNFFVAAFVATIDNFGFGVVIIMFAPLIFSPGYAIIPQDTSLGMKNFLLACSIGAFPLTQFFGSFLAGAYADRVGRKKALLVTLLGTIIGYIFSAVAVYVESVYLLIASRLVAGLFAGNIAVCLAMLADMTGKDKSRGTMYGNLTIVYGFSWSLSIVVGGFLSNPEVCSFFNPTIPFWFTAFISVIAYVVVKRMLNEQAIASVEKSISMKEELIQISHAFKDKATRFSIILILAWAIGWCLATQWLSAYSIQKFSASESAIAVCFLLQGLLWSIGGGLLNPFLLKRFSIVMTAIIGFAVTMILLFAVKVFDTFLGLGILTSVGAVTSVLAMSNALTLLSLSAPEGRQGAMMGIGQSVIALGLIVIPFLGALIGQLDLDLIYPFCGAVFLVAVLLFLCKYKSFKT